MECAESFKLPNGPNCTILGLSVRKKAYSGIAGMGRGFPIATDQVTHQTMYMYFTLNTQWQIIMDGCYVTDANCSALFMSLQHD